MTARLERGISQDYRMSCDMDGATKAALLLLAVQRDKAVALLKSLDANEVMLIAQGAERLGCVTPDLLARVISNFKETFDDGIKFLGTTDEVRKLIVEAVGQDAIVDQSPLATPDTGVPADLWPSIAQLPPEQLRPYIAVQHPQVAAFILSRMEAERIAELTQDLEMDLCSDLLTRMLSKSEPAAEIVRAVEEAISDELLKDAAGGGTQGRAELASVLNRLDRARAAEVLNRLHIQSPADAKAVERMLFRFEDLPNLPPKALTAVVEQMPVDQLVLSLNATDDEFKNSVFGVMSARGRRMAESELQNATDVNPRAVAAARQLAVDTVLRMVASGAVVLPAPLQQ